MDRTMQDGIDLLTSRQRTSNRADNRCETGLTDKKIKIKCGTKHNKPRPRVAM